MTLAEQLLERLANFQHKYHTESAVGASGNVDIFSAFQEIDKLIAAANILRKTGELPPEPLLRTFYINFGEDDGDGYQDYSMFVSAIDEQSARNFWQQTNAAGHDDISVYDVTRLAGPYGTIRWGDIPHKMVGYVASEEIE